MSKNAVEIDQLSVTFGAGLQRAHALRDVSFNIPYTRSVGLVGESGSGKSTLAKVLAGLLPFSSGSVNIGGAWLEAGMRKYRHVPSRLQLIPQDPFSSLSPRRTAGQALAEAMDPRGADVGRHRHEIEYWLERVHLSVDSAEKYPHEILRWPAPKNCHRARSLCETRCSYCRRNHICSGPVCASRGAQVAC